MKNLNLRVQKNPNIGKIFFKVVQIKFLAMHITNQKLSFDIFTVGHLQNIFMEHGLLNILMIFGIKEKFIILTHTMYCCLLLQIYLCYLWLLLCSRVTNTTRDHTNFHLGPSFKCCVLRCSYQRLIALRSSRSDSSVQWLLEELKHWISSFITGSDTLLFWLIWSRSDCQASEREFWLSNL